MALKKMPIGYQEYETDFLLHYHCLCLVDEINIEGDCMFEAIEIKTNFPV